MGNDQVLTERETQALELVREQVAAAKRLREAVESESHADKSLDTARRIHQDSVRLLNEAQYKFDLSTSALEGLLLAPEPAEPEAVTEHAEETEWLPTERYEDQAQHVRDQPKS